MATTVLVWFWITHKIGFGVWQIENQLQSEYNGLYFYSMKGNSKQDVYNQNIYLVWIQLIEAVLGTSTYGCYVLPRFSVVSILCSQPFFRCSLLESFYLWCKILPIYLHIFYLITPIITALQIKNPKLLIYN